MWVPLTLAAALFQVLRNTAMKRLGHALDEYINVWGRYTLLAAFFYAPSVLTIKQAILLSDAYTATFACQVAASVLVTPLVLVTSRRHFGQVHRHWKDFVAVGLFAALTTVSQGIAYTLTLSSYVEPLKQVEILFAMGIGTLAFGEKQKVREIAPGALVMLGGMVLLSLAG